MPSESFLGPGEYPRTPSWFHLGISQFQEAGLAIPYRWWGYQKDRPFARSNFTHLLTPRLAVTNIVKIY